MSAIDMAVLGGGAVLVLFVAVHYAFYAAGGYIKPDKALEPEADNPLTLHDRFMSDIRAKVDAAGGGTVRVSKEEYSELLDLNMIDYIPDSRGEVRVPSVYGRLVIIAEPSPYAYC